MNGGRGNAGRRLGGVGTASSASSSSTFRSRSAAAPARTSDFRRVEVMNQQLQQISSRIERKLQEYRHEAENSSYLLSRANRLTERLAILKDKLRLCFDLCELEQQQQQQQQQQQSSLVVRGGAAPPPSRKPRLGVPDLQLVLRQMCDVDPDDAPPEFVCPITQCVMIDPVRTVDGQCYDRAAILEWFAGFEAKGQAPTSPLTNLVLTDIALTADNSLRSKIQVFLREKSVTEGSERVVDPRGALVVLEAESEAPRPPTRTPIWSSSVVPLHEENSRELNMLRVSDLVVPSSTGSLNSQRLLPHPHPAGGSAAPLRQQRDEAHPSTRTTGRGSGASSSSSTTARARSMVPVSTRTQEHHAYTFMRPAGVTATVPQPPASSTAAVTQEPHTMASLSVSGLAANPPITRESLRDELLRRRILHPSSPTANPDGDAPSGDAVSAPISNSSAGSTTRPLMTPGGRGAMDLNRRRVGGR